MLPKETGRTRPPAAASPACACLPVAALLLAALILLIGGACSRVPERTPIILISIDTCRADHLGCYGETRGLTPHLDALARDGIRFTHAVSPVPITLPAHCSLMTGRYPLQHGVRDNMAHRLPEAETTLAERLRAAGYATAGIVAAFVLDSRFGIAQGFES
ncbi:MAG: sulfatase-like hydrolase/transferase, partial [Candidatus Eisenbacteria bacterium]|nr:sulfatase-like hydrolase/transferase [Candidatus Eisenbacteria bacterium]